MALSGTESPDSRLADALAGRIDGAEAGLRWTPNESAEYRARVARMYAEYDESIGEPMRKWAKEQLSGHSVSDVFYPFSGPDFITAHRLYPSASVYNLVAMQAAGPPPESTLTEDPALLRHFEREHRKFTNRG
ncbi:MAG: hypothetical protein ACPHRO_02195, partial [Nannocystaceae bacterium]